MSELYELDEKIKILYEKFPKKKKELIEKTGEKLYQKVVSNIERLTTERSGKLKKGVTKVIGSGGGYAAIKPNWDIAPHTHLVENGFGNGDDWVHGKHMYRNALNELAKELEEDAEKFLDEMIGEIFD